MSKNKPKVDLSTKQWYDGPGHRIVTIRKELPEGVDASTTFRVSTEARAAQDKDAGTYGQWELEETFIIHNDKSESIRVKYSDLDELVAYLRALQDLVVEYHSGLAEGGFEEYPF